MIALHYRRHIYSIGFSMRWLMEMAVAAYSCNNGFIAPSPGFIKYGIYKHSRAISHSLAFTLILHSFGYHDAGYDD
jgi:hypothetical protein